MLRPLTCISIKRLTVEQRQTALSKPLSVQVCHVIPSINRDIGGPAITVPQLASELARQSVESILASLDYAELGPQPRAPEVSRLTVPAGALSRRLRGWNRTFRKELIALAHCGVHLIHGHGLWMFPNLYARQAAVCADLPLVISPRGMVEPWSLGRSRWKKGLASYAFENGNLAAARLFHATSKAEAASIRSLGLQQPIAVIPNGIELPDPGMTPPRNALEQRHSDLKGMRWLLFLSRLHPKKGVIELLRVWGRLAPQFRTWQLVIAGPDLDGYADIARQQAAAVGIRDRVTFTGMLAGQQKDCALANADLFVLPTHSENFGLAIAEALAHSIPVITTTGAPWDDLVTCRCGWWTEPGEPALTAALLEALQCSRDELTAMGERGRELMARKYSWARVATEMKSVYSWLCERGPRPPCVTTI